MHRYKQILFYLSLLVTFVSCRKKGVSAADYYDYADEAAPVAEDRDDGYGGGGRNVDFLAPLVLFAPLAGLAALYTAAAVNSNSALVRIHQANKMSLT
jgi:hypothetical protein